MKKSVYLSVWDTLFSRFFCPETELFYDYVIDDENNAWHHLPSPDDLKASVPNPCGWGTGMEDSALNGGSMLDALVSAYEVTGDTGIKATSDKILRGLLSCVSEDGFVARSISPFDGKSHYIESSRDQYTHLIYGVLRLFDSPLCDKSQRLEIRRALTAVADRCERDVTEENGYNLTRADGSVGLVCKMWGGVGTHEALRLPMFYLAAHHVSGDTRYLKKYLEYAGEALETSSLHKPETMRCYGTLQMQCSLRAVYEYDSDPAVKEKALAIMKKNAEYGERKAIANSIEFCKPEHAEEINYRFHKWNEVEPRNMGHLNGFDYINPAQSERKDNRAFYPVREVYEGAIVASMCPMRIVSKELAGAVDAMACAVDCKKHSSIYALLLLVCARAALEENKRKDIK